MVTSYDFIDIELTDSLFKEMNSSRQKNTFKWQNLNKLNN